MDTPCEIIPFTSEEFGELRTMSIGGEPWFVAKDVCDALGIDKTAASRLDDDEKGLRSTHTLGGVQKTLFVNEPGFYKLVMKSRKPQAKAFQRWVTHEVLPAIRRTGGYMAARPDETPEELMARALMVANDTMERQRRELDALRPKALFADSVANSGTLMLIRDLAHVLCQHGFKTGQQRLFALLREDGYLEKHRNEPTQRSIELGVMRVVEHAHTKPDGSVFVTRTPKVTGKGQAYFVARYCGEAM